MTRAVYVVGGAGSGKSTFMAELLRRMGAELGPLEDVYAARNAKYLVTLRGHRFAEGRGLYLGHWRDVHPGTDGLDRSSGTTGEKWLQAGLQPPLIVAEGITLSTQRFMKALREHTDLLLVHLTVDPVIADLRFQERGTSQDERFVAATVTRAANVTKEADVSGQSDILEIDTSDPEAWDAGLRNVIETLPEDLVNSGDMQ